jgi:hypothetical protein
MCNVLDLPLDASISRLIIATTPVGSMHTPWSIAGAASRERGTVPDADLVVAAVRRWAAVAGDAELGLLCDELDEILDS